MREQDNVVVGHIYDKAKTYLPMKMKSHYIKTSYETKLITLGKHAVYAHEELEENKSSKAQIWDLAQRKHTSIMVIGGHGRKGPKKDETVLGTAIQFLAVDSRFPCMIIKDRVSRKERPDKCINYGICFDGSEKAVKTLNLVLSMMSKEDRLTSLTIKEGGMQSDDSLRHSILTKAQDHGIKNVDVQILEKVGTMRACEQIEEHIQVNCSDPMRQSYINFMAVGNVGMRWNGSSEKYLGSVANTILRCRKLNTIFVS